MDAETDLFGSDSDEEMDKNAPFQEEQQCIFNMLCERKLFLKESEDLIAFSSSSSSSSKMRGKISKTILVVCKERETPLVLTQKLQTLQPSPLFTLSCDIEWKNDISESYDIIVDLSTTTSESTDLMEGSAKVMYSHLVPGGLYVYIGDTDLDVGRQHAWCTLHARQVVMTRKNTTISVLRKAALLCNSTGAVYWASDIVHKEECHLASVTISLSTEERRRNMLSMESHNSAVDILKREGICIIKGLFDSKYIKYLGDQSLKDLQMAMKVLKDQKGIDLEKPGEEGQPMINNFHELSMREALRCDLRNGKHMKQALQSHQQSTDRLQHNPYVLKMLKEAMHQSGADESGNWGRWNFEGSGPQSGPPDIKAGKIGTIISMPGCGDQTIHSDTSHIFVHTQLPAHYVNMFMIATGGESADAETDLSIGQTAFVLGSHALNVSKVIMVDQNIDELTERLVRPHLEPGDALFFDCRILHFGLANQSNTGHFPSSLSHKNLFMRSKRLGEVRMKLAKTVGNESVFNSLKAFDLGTLDSNSLSKHSNGTSSEKTSSSSCTSIHDLNMALTDDVLAFSTPKPQRRAILYVNYTHTWFHDPKNWNDAERLFSV